jgi:arsenite-transporting ATPase
MTSVPSAGHRRASNLDLHPQGSDAPDGCPHRPARVVLVTGKGGVGKTTLSAATAVRAAERGARTLLVSTDEAHSLEDVLLHELGSEPVPVTSDLDGLQLDGRYELQRSWGSIIRYLRRLLGITELDRLQIDELCMVPGLDQLVALARLRELVDDGRWDAVVVDCAPSADSLRLLALPEILGWYVERLFGRNGTLNKWARRRIERTMSLPVPDDSVVSSITAMTDELSGLRTTLDAGRTTARIVVTPERVVIAEAERTMSYLALYGYAVDAVLVNRTPGTGAGPAATDPWATAAQPQLERIDRAFAAVPRLQAHRRVDEPLGLVALAELGWELYGRRDPLATMADRPPLRIASRGDETVVRLLVPGVQRDRIDVEHDGDELFVTLGAYRRSVPLPDALRRRQVVRAGLDGSDLEIVFAEPPYAV